MNDVALTGTDSFIYIFGVLSFESNFFFLLLQAFSEAVKVSESVKKSNSVPREINRNDLEQEEIVITATESQKSSSEVICTPSPPIITESSV